MVKFLGDEMWLVDHVTQVWLDSLVGDRQTVALATHILGTSKRLFGKFD
jgi:hypothetical protein